MSSTLKTAVLLAFLSGLLIVAGGAIGGRGGLVIAFLFAVVMNVGSYWFSDKIVLRMYRAQPVGPDHPLHRMTARLAQRAGLPMPKVYIIPDMSPNAFATGRNPQHAAVAATEGHDAAASRERTGRRDRARTGARQAPRHPDQHHGRDDRRRDHDAGAHGDVHPDGERETTSAAGATRWWSWRLVLLAPLAATIIQLAISRQREFGADRGGAEIAGSPMGLASALRHIEGAVRQIPMDANPATAHMFIMSPFAARRHLEALLEPSSD